MPHHSKGLSQSSTDTSDWDIDQHIPGAFPESVSDLPSHLTTTQQSLAEAVQARRKEYTRPRRIRIKIGSWNVAALKGTEKDIGGWFIEGRGIEEAFTGLNEGGQNGSRPSSGTTASRNDGEQREPVEAQEQRANKHAETLPRGDSGSVPGGEDVGLYVLGLQEIVDIASITEAIRPTTDPTPSNKIKAAIDEVLPLGYHLVAQEQLIGLLLLVYAHASVLEDVQNVSTTSVGTGLGGYMGNKGAVTARLILGETTRMVFVNSHLAAGADKAALERRNWDAANITSRTRFAPIVDSMGITQSTGEKIGDEDYAFWFGDLNYRLEGIPGDEVRRLLMLHTRNEYDIQKSASAKKINEEITAANASVSSQSNEKPDDRASAASSTYESTPESPAEIIPAELDPASLQTTLNSLLPHDELHQQMKSHKAFNDGWAEGPIRFLPTYKYDVGSVGVYDSSEKKRCPSWCDRILYRTRRRYEEYLKWAQEQEDRRKKEEEDNMHLNENKSDDNVLFDYDPTADGETAQQGIHDYDDILDSDCVTTREKTDSEIILEYYVSHQRVLSSDHKPLSAIFSLVYDAVIPEERQRVHAEVARELDRAENEGRPTITLIVDHAPDSDTTITPDHSSDAVTINFGKLSASETKKRSITIANTGRVPATMTFVNRPTMEDDSTIAGPTTPAWLSVHWDRDPDAPRSAPKSPKKSRAAPPAPPEYTLQPGDACSLDLVARVDNPELIRSLDSNPGAGTATLDDILILRVRDGRDHFLPVAAHWAHSALERSIDKLKSSVEGSVRRWQRQKPTASSSSSAGTSSETAEASPVVAGELRVDRGREELVASPKPVAG